MVFPNKERTDSLKITEHADIITRNIDRIAVVYSDEIPGSNVTSLFKSMVSNKTTWTKWASMNFSAHYKALVWRNMI